MEALGGGEVSLVSEVPLYMVAMLVSVFAGVPRLYENATP